MIIADIIKEFESVSKPDLLIALQGMRSVYSIFPPLLKKQMLAEYSNLEYAILSAIRAESLLDDTQDKTIFDMYDASRH